MLLRVAVFYVLTLVFTVLLGGLQGAIGLAPEAATLPQWGPGLAALLMLVIFRQDGHRFSLLDRRIPASRYALAVLIPVGGALAIILITSVLLGMDSFGDLAGVPWGILIWVPLGALGEELGWRGYLHKRLDARLSGLASSLIVGGLWAAWHVGAYANGGLYMAFFILQIVAYAVVIHALVADIGFNVLVAALFHLAINIGNLFSYPLLNEARFVAVSSLVWVGITIFVVLTRPDRFRAAPPAG